MWAGIILCVCAHRPAIAAQPLSLGAAGGFLVEKVSTVPAMTVRAMVQTRDGYLWIGSYDALYRFDGVRLVTFNVANTPSLSSGSIRVLHEDQSGNLWIGTDDAGLARYRDGEFLRLGPEQGLTEPEVLSICEDGDGTIWIGTRRGLFAIGKGKMAAARRADVLMDHKVETLAAQPNGRLWIGTSKGLFRLDRDHSDPVGVLTNHYVQSLAIDSNETVWVTVNSRRNYRISPRGSETDVESRYLRYFWFRQGRSNDLWLAGPKGSLLHSTGGDLTNATAVAQFERPNITSICDDSDGNVWVGIESHGLYRLRRKRVVTLTGADGIPTENLTTIVEDSRGRIWLGTFGNGLLVAGGEGSPFERRAVPDVANITGLHETRDGTLWFGTYNGDRYRSVGAQFVAFTKGAAGCRVILEDRSGALWIGTLRDGVEWHQAGQVDRFTTRDGLSSDRITSLVQDKNGDVWVGTYRGLNRFSGGKIKRFAGDEALRDRSIRGLHADPDGTVWIGTSGAGLLRYRNEQLRTISSRNGLPSDTIESVIDDNEGRMWLATAGGIVCIPRDELEACADGRKGFVNCITLGTEDGMVLARCGTGFKPDCMKSRSGLLWFCTTGGLVVVDPATIRPRSQPPPVYIEEVIADDKPVPLRRGADDRTLTAVISPGTARVGFRYTALSLGAPERVQFRYRLESYDDDWVSARAAREAFYTHLPAGQYEFRVLATGKGGMPNEIGAALAVIVVPPWWQTWWFRAIAIVCLGGLIFGLYEYRVYQFSKARTTQELFARRLIESQEQERKRVAGELHDSLGQSLQIIKGRAQLGLGRGDQSNAHTKQLEEICEAATQAIHEVRAISHALRPAELDQLGLTRSLEWMARQAGATSQTRFACELENVDKLFPPEIEISLYRIAQEGFNNVLRHAEASEAILELKREDGVVRLSLFDNGRGFAKAVWTDSTPSRFGQGLTGIAERVKLLGGELDVQSAPGRGTRLTVTCKISTVPHEG